MAGPTPINLNGATPAAPSGLYNVVFQADANNPRNVSAYIPNVAVGVVTLNGEAGNLTLAAGANITINTSGGTITITSSGGGGGSGLPTLAFNSGGTSIFGGTWWGSTTTLTPGANHTLHLRMSCKRSATTQSIAFAITGDGGTTGYLWVAQTDGNHVNYYYSGGAQHAISASGGGGDDTAGANLLDLYIPITTTATNGIGTGGMLYSPGGQSTWPAVNQDKHVDATGTLTVYVSLDAIASLNVFNYEVL